MTCHGTLQTRQVVLCKPVILGGFHGVPTEFPWSSIFCALFPARKFAKSRHSEAETLHSKPRLPTSLRPAGRGAPGCALHHCPPRGSSVEGHRRFLRQLPDTLSLGKGNSQGLRWAEFDGIGLSLDPCDVWNPVFSFKVSIFP